MTSNVHRFAARYAPQGEEYASYRNRDFDYAPGDDEAAPRKRRRRGLLRRLVFVFAIFGIGWAVYENPSRVGHWWSFANEKIAPVVARLIEPAPSPSLAVAEAEPPPLREVKAAPNEPEPAVAAPLIPIATAGSAEAPQDGEATADPATPQAPKVIAALPPVRGVVSPPTRDAPAQTASARRPASKRDLLELRALSAGLHPKLSRVLLSRLSKADFRNAGYAVRTALAKTADGATFRWPSKRKAGLAVFEVRFVPGAAKGCRRYVVTVEKNRWLTTALPIEKCGVGLPQRTPATKS